MIASRRWQLEAALWKRGLTVGVLAPRQAPSVDVYPIFLPNHIEASSIERKLTEIAGRLGVASIRGAWLDGGLYSLELPREQRQRVDYERISASTSKAALPWLFGVSNAGSLLVADVARMPHMLIAGATGAGKSNSVTAALAHLLTARTPKQVQVLLLDPKRVDLLPFASLPHTLAHVVELDAVVSALQVLVTEMQRRYSIFAKVGVKDLQGYNSKAVEPLPAIVCVIDELGMLMDTQVKVLEHMLLSLLQTARASGIHLVIGTQRPDADILRARLRANLRARVCFRVPDAASSRLIVESDSGAGLLGAGDGLYLDAVGNLCRFQSPFISDEVLQVAISKAAKHHATGYVIKGLSLASEVLPSFEGLSRVDAASLLCERLEWINSTTLINAGICDSQTVAKGVLKHLRSIGMIGKSDPSKKASPVRRDTVSTVQQQTDTDATQADKLPHNYPTQTTLDGLDGFQQQRLALVSGHA